MSIAIKISFSSDHMEATAEAERQSEEDSLDVEAIKLALVEAGVRHGTDEEACKQLAEWVNKRPPGGLISHVVAAGTPVINGENGRIEMAVEYHRRDHVDTVQESGKIDFHDLGAFTPIEKDQVLATIVLHTAGTPGTNVLGHETQPVPGKPAVFRLGQGTKVVDKTELRSTRVGDLRYVDEMIEVMDTVKVSGNLDFQVGNIDCEGKVQVNGDVLPGFKIRASGDVTISGVVDSAEINSNGTVVVKQGVLGGSRIYAKRGIVVGYIRESYLESDGNIKIANEAFYSTVLSADTIALSGSGRVVGGRLLARNNIAVGTAGQENGIPTFLAAGVSPLDELNAAKLEVDINRAAKREAIVGRMKDLAKPEVHQELDRLLLRQTAKREHHLEELTALQKKMIDYTRCRIKVNTAVHPGVLVRIGPKKVAVKIAQTATTFSYDLEARDIAGIKPEAKP